MKRTHQFWAVSALMLGLLAVFGLRAVDEPRNNFRFAILGERTGGARP